MIHHLEAQVLLLLLIASLVGMGARRLKLPYTLALVLAGLALGFVHLDTLHGISLTPELLLLLFLPPLLFEAAFHLHVTEFRKNLVHILFLAGPGVLVAVCCTAALAYAGINLTGLEPEFGWAAAFLFASVISATDPISVLALFKELGAPRRLYLLVEGESLVNDGIAVVVFGVILAILGLPDMHGVETVLEGTGEIIRYATLTVIKSAVGGALIGALIGGIMSVLARQIDDHLIEITLTSVVAWGSFLVAEQLHLSGVLSTVAAGMVVGSFGSKYGMSPTTRVAVNDFWAYMGFLSNSFIFLMVGLELESRELLREMPLVLIGFLAVVGGRAVLLYGVGPIVDQFAERVPRAYKHVMVWGGLRGSLSMVLILTLPADYVHRPMLITLVFGVVAGSLFIQGLTIGKLMDRLGLTRRVGEEVHAYERARGASLAAAYAIKHADKLHADGMLDERTHRTLTEWYRRRRDRLGTVAKQLADTTREPERLIEGVKTLAATEREWVRHAAQAGVISTEAGSALITDLDERIHWLDDHGHEDPSEEALIEHLDAALTADGHEPPT